MIVLDVVVITTVMMSTFTAAVVAAIIVVVLIYYFVCRQRVTGTQLIMCAPALHTRRVTHLFMDCDTVKTEK